MYFFFLIYRYNVIIIQFFIYLLYSDVYPSLIENVTFYIHLTDCERLIY